jgi:hypothetical protein
MADPVAGLREMGRVTRPGGVVAACVWDHAGGRGPLSAFWQAVRELDPGADDESSLAGVREGHLAELFAQAGLDAVQVTTLTVRVRQDGFESWWETFTLGVGPAGAYLAALPAGRRDELRERCRRQLPEGPFEVSATAWAATARRGLVQTEAEGVPRRVEEHPERCARLMPVLGRAEIEHRRLGGVEIVDDDVEVHLLGHFLSRPSWRGVGLHLQEGDALTVLRADVSVVGGDLDFPIQHGAVEGGERGRVGTVDNDAREACDSHARHGIRSRRQSRSGLCL